MQIAFERWCYFVDNTNLVGFYRQNSTLDHLKRLTKAVQKHDLPFDPFD